MFFKDKVCLFLKFKDDGRTRGLFFLIFEDFLEILRNFSEFPQKRTNILLLRIFKAEGYIFLKLEDK